MLPNVAKRPLVYPFKQEEVQLQNQYTLVLNSSLFGAACCFLWHFSLAAIITLSL